jgi:tetratricopeptide (TPR) repeat protein
MRVAWRLIVVVVPVAIVIWFVAHSRSKPVGERLRSAREALREGRLDEAFESATSISDGPLRNAALLTAGEVRQRQERFDEAVSLYLEIGEEADEAVVAKQTAGDILLRQGQWSRAEEVWRGVLRTSPADEFVLNRLVLLLAMEGRRWESRELVETLVRNETCTPESLSLAGDLDHVIDSRSEIQAARVKSPNDVVLLLGLAKIRIEEGESDEAKTLIDQVLKGRPELVEGWIVAGQWAVDRPGEEYHKWLRGVAAVPAVQQHPDFWVILGRHEELAARPESAARCYYQAARLHPDSIAAHYHLGRKLQALRSGEEARPFIERAARLERLRESLDAIRKRPNAKRMGDVADLLEELGRIRESRLWTRLVCQSSPGDCEALRPDLMRRESAVADPEFPMVVASACPALQIDLTSLPLPVLQRIAHADRSGDFMRETVALKFIDEAEQAGLNFTYFNSSDPTTDGMRMFEFTGGGVGAADYDRDGWPDLYLTQGAVFPKSVVADGRIDLDRLFRNLGNGRFGDATLGSGIVDPYFSQGLAWGDLNHDGFCDLYIGNFGPNRLWLNNGDGTFSDVSEDLSDRGGDAWSTSVGMADLDGDGAVDLYAVNYVEGPEVTSRLCLQQGRMRTCHPTVFPAAEDSFHRGTGTGQFQEATVEAGLSSPNGLGLGLTIADFDGDLSLDLFVANDSVPNFFFVRERGSSPARFHEMAYANGTAVDSDGKPQACMGIAVDDLNEDGLLDMYITNFYQESNVLYRNLGEGLFSDATREADLRELCYLLLGFGVQSLDADGDGRRDLVIANGHIDDMRDLGIPFRMPPVLLMNQGEGRFTRQPAQLAGGYFETDRLGRGLAVIDWNRDGREDFAVSHLDEPMALVTNRSSGGGHWLKIHVVGTQSPRAPIGASVTVRESGRERVKQLTAGNGYQCSNSPELVWALESEAPVTVEIRWPSGRRDEWSQVPANREVVCIEGQGWHPVAPVGASP